MNLDPMKATREFLAGVVARKRPNVYLTAASDRRDGGVGERRAYLALGPEKRGLVRRILMLGAVPIPPNVTDIYEKIGVDRAKGRQLVAEAVNAGLVLEHQYHPSRRGGAVKVLENTEAGYGEIREFGCEPPKRRLQGAWNHNLCGVVLEAIGKRQRYEVFFEVLIGREKDTRVDEIWQSPDGRRVFWQCGFSSAEREAEAVVRIRNSGVLANGKVIVVCRDSAFKTRLVGLLKHHNARDQFSEHVGLMVFGDVLEHYYKKSAEALV